MSKDKKFLILGIPNYANRRILFELNQMGMNARILNPQQLLPFVNDKRDDRIYIQRPGHNEPKRIYKKSLTAIVPRIGGNLQFYSKAVEHIENNIGIPSTASAVGLLNAQDKITTIQMLSQHGIKTPKTFAVKKTDNLEWVVDKLGGFPVVAKLIYGSQGIGVFILTEPLSASTALDAFSSQGHALLLQQFIETAEKDNAKHDFRAVVVDGKVVAAIKRKSVGKDFRTNASIKEDCEKATLTDEMNDIAIRAAAAVGLACAGVDLAVDINTGEIYCYEVNGNFNFKSTEKFSKINVGKFIAEYAVKIGANNSQSTTKSAKETDLKQLAKYWRVSPKAFSHQMDEAMFQIAGPLPEIANWEPEFEIDSLKNDIGLPFGDFPEVDDNDPLDDMELGIEPMRVQKGDNTNIILHYSELSSKGRIPSYLRTPISLKAMATHGKR